MDGYGKMIRVEMNKNDVKKIDRALPKILETARIQAQQVTRKEAIQFTNLIVSRIMNQRLFMAGYKPYNQRYAAWKALNYPSVAQKFWYLEGDLMRAVRPTMLKDRAWFAGVLPSARDSGGKSWLAGKTYDHKQGRISYKPQTRGPRQITLYGSVNERLRPLFGPTEEDYASSSDRSALHKKAILQVLRQWKY